METEELLLSVSCCVPTVMISTVVEESYGRRRGGGWTTVCPKPLFNVWDRMVSGLYHIANGSL